MILVQPVQKNAKAYMDTARKYGLGFELMDMAFAGGIEQAAKQVKENYESQFLYSCHGVFADINYSGSDPWIYRESEKRIRQCIEAGLKAGIKKYVFHSCFHPVLRPDDPLYDAWSRQFAELFCSMAEQYGTDFYMENVLDISPLILQKMMQAASHPRIHICLDVGHANFSGSSIDEWVESLHPYISYFHLNDNMGRYDDHLPVGEGTVNYSLLKELIERYGIQADYTLEVKDLDAVERSLEALAEIFGKEFFHAGQ